MSVIALCLWGCSALSSKRDKENTAALSAVLSESEVVWFGECDTAAVAWADARGRRVTLPDNPEMRATVCGRVSIASGSYRTLYAEAERWRATGR